jgi:cytochrome c556
MRPLFCVAGLLAVLALAGLASGPAGATSDDETPTIKKVMSKLHKGKTAPLNVLKTALKGSSPNWEKVQKEAKIYAEYSAAMPKNDPPRGDKESYDKLAEAFASAGKSLEESAEKEALKGSRDALKKITGSCMPCHKSHKPN